MSTELGGRQKKLLITCMWSVSMHLSLWAVAVAVNSGGNG